MQRNGVGPAVLAVSLACLGASAPDPPQPPPVTPAAEPSPTRIHEGGTAFEQRMLDAIRACLREDSSATVDALDRLDAACRKLAPESPGATHGILVYDQALHLALAKSRELADRGEMAKAFDEMVWVTRQCFKCHQVARNEGRMPALPGDSNQAPVKP